MEIEVIRLGHIKTNCYLLSNENAAIVIDPGFVSERTEEFFAGNRGKEKIILLTHAHFDHIGGVADLKEKFGVPVGIGKTDAKDLCDKERNLSLRFHAKTRDFSADILFSDGDTLTVGKTEIKVIATPGHTAGGVSYLIGDNLFAGDTLFLGSVGRTDGPGGDTGMLLASVKKLYTLPDSIAVFPGHGEATTVGYEKKYNPFVRG